MDLAHVKSVGKPLSVPVHYEHMRTLTLERSPTNAELVVKPSVVPVTFKTMKKLIMENSTMNMRNVWRRLF